MTNSFFSSDTSVELQHPCHSAAQPLASSAVKPHGLPIQPRFSLQPPAVCLTPLPLKLPSVKNLFPFPCLAVHFWVQFNQKLSQLGCFISWLINCGISAIVGKPSEVQTDSHKGIFACVIGISTFVTVREKKVLFQSKPIKIVKDRPKLS